MAPRIDIQILRRTGAPAPPSLLALFLAFLRIGATSLGGGLAAWIRREIVEQRRWLDDQQFLSVYGVSQIVPGATNVNLAVTIGAQLRGAPGALVAVAGMMAVPLTILITFGTVYFAAHGWAGARLIDLALAGAGASAIGFNIATGIRLGRTIAHPGSLLIAGAIIIGIGVLRIPLLKVLLVMLPLSLALAVARGAR